MRVTFHLFSGTSDTAQAHVPKQMRREWESGLTVRCSDPAIHQASQLAPVCCFTWRVPEEKASPNLRIKRGAPYTLK